MKKIKLCFIIVRCRRTGPMNQTLNIIKYLDFNKYDVSFVTLFQENPYDTMIDSYFSLTNQNVCLNLSKVSSLIVGKRKLKRVLEKWQPDIIQGLGMPPYRLSLDYKEAKHLVTLRNYAYEDYPSHYNKLIGPLLAFMDIQLIKKLFKQGEIFVTCSRSLTDIYYAKEDLKLPFIRNGVDLSKFRNRNSTETLKLRDKLGLPQGKIIFIYTGPFIDRKDQESAVQAILACRNREKLCIVFCGEGTNYPTMREKYMDIPNVIFTGNVSNVSEYLRAADLYVSTSKSEGMPNSVLEAMASGLGVVLSDIPQHMELFEINVGIGLHYPLGDTKMLAAQIDCAVEADYLRMGEQSHLTVNDNLTAEIMSKKYQKLYEEMLIEKES